MNKQPVRYALLSVYNKRGIVKLAKTLIGLGIKIISTGGTAQELTDHHIQVISIQEVTGEPESFDGRMKTISFQIESGILFDRKNPSHQKQAKQLGIKQIDIVVCNLYPFEKKNTIENIDVGGPTMIRAAAKNFQNVLVVIDPADYEKLAQCLLNNITNDYRQELAAKAFAHLSLYDSLIAKFLNKKIFPDELTLPLRKLQDLRYGENPHQKAALYLEPAKYSPLYSLKKLYGRDLSLVNITDINAGLEVVRFMNDSTAVIIKHNSPCGIAIDKTISQALVKAIKADSVSAFGGVIVINREADLVTVKEVGKFKDEIRGNIDIFACPSIDNEALLFLEKVRKSLGIYTFGKIKRLNDRVNYKWVDNGLVIQESDDEIEEGFKSWEIVTKKKPTEKQLEQMKIAWMFISRIRSNSVIVIDKMLPMTRGIGSGQTSRIAATSIALDQAGKYVKGSILASDSFFPFDDSVILAAKYGIGAIIQQGGSIHDKDSIIAADKAKIPMIFTNRRAFWH